MEDEKIREIKNKVEEIKLKLASLLFKSKVEKRDIEESLKILAELANLYLEIKIKKLPIAARPIILFRLIDYLYAVLHDSIEFNRNVVECYLTQL